MKLRTFFNLFGLAAMWYVFAGWCFFKMDGELPIQIFIVATIVFFVYLPINYLWDEVRFKKDLN